MTDLDAWTVDVVDEAGDLQPAVTMEGRLAGVPSESRTADSSRDDAERCRQAGDESAPHQSALRGSRLTIRGCSAAETAVGAENEPNRRFRPRARSYLSHTALP